MALKLLEAHVPSDLCDEAEELLREVARATWTEPGGSYGAVVRAVVGTDRSGRAMDLLHEKLSPRGGLRVLIQPLDAVLPRPLASQVVEGRSEIRSAAAVSREEVYGNIADGAALSRDYLALVVLASVVAAIGLARNNAAAVIGAMVVAPLLAPIMALSLGLVLGERALVGRALSTNGAGFALSFVSAAGLGLLLRVDPTLPELASRTQVGVSDMVLALAAGCAGTLAYTSGAPAFLTGVMVAVALLPPAVAGGLLLSVGELRGMLAALLLSAANVTALTLASMVTFLWRDMRPRRWWEADRAKRSARWGIAVFAALFLGLVALVLASRRFFET